MQNVNYEALEELNHPFLTETFKRVYEDHLTFIKEHVPAYVLNVTPDMADRNRYHFYKLLNELSIPKHMHWIILRFNDRRDPTEYLGDIREIRVPKENFLDTLMAFEKTYRY